MPLDLVPVFDGHNDTLLKLELQAGTKRSHSFFEEAVFDHINLPRARRGGFAGGLFAIFVPSRLPLDHDNTFNPSSPADFAPITQKTTLDFTLPLMARTREIENASEGQVVIARSSAEIHAAISAGQLAMMLHIEGAEAIDTDFNALERRSSGPATRSIFRSTFPT